MGPCLIGKKWRCSQRLNRCPLGVPSLGVDPTLQTLASPAPRSRVPTSGLSGTRGPEPWLASTPQGPSASNPGPSRPARASPPPPHLGGQRLLWKPRGKLSSTYGLPKRNTRQGPCVAPRPRSPAAPRARRGSLRPRSAGPALGREGRETPQHRRCAGGGRADGLGTEAPRGAQAGR